nr:gliding motility-associated C-terminal domain-containing protein [uncultured Allomuricauda sp.]
MSIENYQFAKNRTPFLLIAILFIFILSVNAAGTSSNKKESTSSETSFEKNINSTNMFVPGIGLIKTGVVAPLPGGSNCGQIIFTYTVSNESTAGEVLENIEITDTDLGGVILNGPPASGDLNFNVQLDPGETWTYEFIYIITQTDIDNGSFGTLPANVTSNPVGLPLVSVDDVSDPIDVAGSDPTIINLSACQPRIAVIKAGTAIEDIEQGPGCNLIIYEFQISNEGGTILENVVLNDPLVGGDVAGPLSGDENNNSLLDLDEIWIYSAVYAIQDTDINNGFVENQATTTADVFGQPGNTVQDLSDDNSVLEDDTTIIDLTFCQSDIAVIKTGIAVEAVDAGLGCNFIIYQFEVTNLGAQILENVVLNDPLLGGNIDGPIAGDDNNDNFLHPDETWFYVANYEITPENINDGFVENQATASAEIQGTGVSVNDFSDDNSILEDDPTIIDLSDCDQGPGIGLIKEGQPIDFDGDGCIESILYTFTVTNLGDVDLDEVLLEDPLFGGPIPGPDSESIAENGILQVDEVWIYTAIYAITQADIDATVVINQATVTAESVDTDGQVTDQSDDDSNFQDQPTRTEVPNDACTEGAPEIGLIKEGELIDYDGDGCEDSIRYTFTVANLGDVDLEEVVLEDNLFNGQIPGPQSESLDENNILQVSEVWTYTALYALKQEDIDAEIVINQAIVYAEPVGSDNQVVDTSDDDSFTEDQETSTRVFPDSCPEGAPEIGLIKEGELIDFDGDGCEDSILYTFTVANLGNIDLEEVVLEDELFNGEIPGPQFESLDVNNILQVNEFWTYTAVYALEQEDIDAEIVFNQAIVYAEPVGTDDQVQDVSDDDSFAEDQETSTRVQPDSCPDGAPEIGLIKQGELVDVDGDGCIESILYTFTITNLGDVDLEDVSLIDETLFGQAEIPGPDSESIAENGILQVDEIWVYTALYEITQDDIDATIVVNQAIVTAEPMGSNNQVIDQSDDDSNFENQPTRTEVPDDACTDGGGSIGLIKEGQLVDVDDDGCIESILFTFTVTNLGNVDLENVSLVDETLFGQAEIPGPDSESIEENEILQVGEVWVYTTLYSITQTDIEATVVVNQAIVSAEPVGLDGQVVDLSDDDSNLENQPTRTEVPDDACTEGGASIGLVKEGVLVDLDNDGCIESIRYTFTVTNLGDVDLENLSLTDETLFEQLEIPGPDSESIEENGVLQVGEVWIYMALYAITQADIDAITVVNQALVSAEPVDSDGKVVDLSDDDSNFENNPTRTEVPDDACPGDDGGTPLFGIGVIKTGVPIDTDNDGCDDSIRYDFTVTNTGVVNLENIQVTDDLLGGIVNGLEITEETGDGILQTGEVWVFTALYNVTQQNIDAIFLENQALVTANIEGLLDNVFDLSDDDSYQEDDATILNVSNFCEPTGNDDSSFRIYNGITPNGDGFNDYFRIVGIEDYPNNNMKIFNRWGVEIYNSDNYGQGNNVFRGVSEGRATIDKSRDLPSGTYFYILTFTGENPGSEEYSGYLYINRD